MLAFTRLRLSIVCLCFVLAVVFADGPVVTSLNYHSKSYQTLEEQNEMAVVTATFDQDLFVKLECNDSKSDAIIQPCCTDSHQTQCLNSTTINQCLDTNPRRGAATRSESQHFMFKVTNPAECRSITILTRAITGDPDLYVALSSAPPGSLTPDVTSKYRAENIGSDAWSLCCDEINRNSVGWTGFIYFTLFASSETTYELEILTTSLLNITDAYALPQLQVDCNGNNALSVTDCSDFACASLPPTPDPLFSYLAALSGLPVTLEYRSKQLSIALYLRRERFTSITTSTTRLPFAESLLTDSTCVYTFPNIVNAAGEYMIATLPLKRSELPCSQTSFRGAVQGIDDVLNSLRASSPDGIDVVTDFVQQSAAYVVSDAWVGCIDMIENSLLKQQFAQQSVSNTTSCFVTDTSSEAYFSDPCCNPDLELQMCCVPRDISAPVASFAVNINALNSTCSHSRCAEPVLNDYIVLRQAAGTLGTGCAEESIKALNDPLFVVNPLSSCQAQVFQQRCNSAGDCDPFYTNSTCLLNGWCALPCQTNEDCITGNCTTIAQVKTCVLYDPSGADRTGNRLLIECLNKNINSFVNLFIRQELGLNSSSSDEEFQQKVFEDLSEFACVGDIGTIPASHQTNQTLCEGTRACNWVTCTDLAAPTTCTEENCLDPYMGSENFCLACLSKSNCFEISVFPRCEYTTYNGRSGCEAVGGHYNPIAGVVSLSEVCWRATNSSYDTCFPSNLCTTVTQQRCDPACYFPATDEASCTGTIDGFSVTWRGVSGGAGACVASSVVSQGTCTGPNAQWWPGTLQWEGSFVNEQECTSYGYCEAISSFTTEADCLSNYYCEGCRVCPNQDVCESQGTCDARFGCHLPFNAEGDCTLTSDIWTPNGCWRESIISPSGCTSLGGTWLNQATSRAQCENRGFICAEPQTAGLTSRRRRNERPAGISFKNATECELCSGAYQSFYTFTSNRWIPSRYVPGQWKKREWSQAHLWAGSIDTDRFDDLHARSAARRYANIAQSNILCRYGKSSQVADQLSCDCGADESDSLCFNTLSKQVVQVAQVCTNIPVTIATPLGSLTASPQIAVDGSDCSEISVAVVPVNQFSQRRQVSLSSVSVSLSQSGRVDQLRFIKNQQGVAIGELISDGVEFTPSNRIVQGLQVCLTIAGDWNSSLPAAYFDIAYPTDANYTGFATLGLALGLDTREICFDYLVTSTEDVTAFFPVILIQDYNNASFIQGLFPGEIFIIFFGVLIYLLTTIFTLFHLGKHITAWIHGDKARSFLSLSRVALMVLALVLLIRLVYLLLLPFGIIEQYKPVDVIFSELPALLFCYIYSIIVLRWAEIYHFSMSGAKPGFSKLKPAVIVLIVFLGVAFIVLLALFLAIVVPVIRVDCTTPEEEINTRTATEIVAIVYKVFFAAICIALSALFVLYGVRIVRLMRQGAVQSDKSKLIKRKRTMYRLMVISGVSAVCLLAQAANLFWSSFDQSRNIYGVLVFLYIIEIAPSIIFILMFKRGSLFSRYNRKQDGTQGSGSGQGSTASGNATSMRTRMTSVGQSDALEKSDVLDRSEVVEESSS